MGKIGIGAFGAILLLVFEVAPLFGWPVPDTGQTTCYNDVGAVIVVITLLSLSNGGDNLMEPLTMETVPIRRVDLITVATLS